MVSLELIFVCIFQTPTNPGTRPETIKMAPILHQLQENASAFRANGITDFKSVFTGQHPDLVSPFAKYEVPTPCLHRSDAFVNTARLVTHACQLNANVE